MGVPYAAQRGAAQIDDRRASPRVRARLRVQLSNLKETFGAWTVDVSPGGALFRIENPRFYHGGDGDTLLALTRQVEHHFERGLTVVFGGGVLRRRMRFVRTATDDVTNVPLVACSFYRPLTAPECVLLGITGPTENWG